MNKKTRIILLVVILLGLLAIFLFQNPQKLDSYYGLVKNMYRELVMSLQSFEDKHFEYLSSEQEYKLIDLIKQKKFSELELYFTELTRKMKRNIKYEYKLYQSYGVFDSIQNVKLDVLNDWVNTNPVSNIPLIARGIHLRHLAWRARGYQFVSKTSQAQLENMRKYLRLAYKDIVKALEYDNDNSVTYAAMIDLLAPISRNRDLAEYFYAGVNKMPGSYVLRFTYLNYLQPKWGGSYSKMRSFVEAQDKYIEAYPGVARLKAYYYYMRAREYAASKPERALLFYLKSLEYDRFWHSLGMAGRMYEKLGDYNAAIKYFTEAVKRKPNYPYAYIHRAFSYRLLGDYKRAEKETRFTIAKYPDIYEIRADYVNMLKDLKRYDDALAVIQSGKKAIPEKMSSWRGKTGIIYFHQKKYLAALSEFRSALKLDNKNATYWNYIAVISRHHIVDKKLSVDAAEKAMRFGDKPYYIYNYAAALYIARDKLAPEIFKKLLITCRKKSCNKAEVKWAKRFLRCVNRERGCDLDRHDYQAWLQVKE